MKSFWERPVRIIQNNLRAVDADGMDVAKLMQEQFEYGSNAIIANAGGLLCWYDSEVSSQPKNPWLSFDYVQAVIQEAHRLKMKVLLRMDVSNLTEQEALEHPEWIRRDPQGKVTYDLGMVQSCINSPKWHEYNFSVLKELLEKYEADGIFYNAVHYGFCHCDACKQKYLRDTGRELPEILRNDTEEGRAYFLYRYEQTTLLFKKIRDYIRQLRPGCILAPVGSIATDMPEFNCFSGWDTVPFMQESQDIQVSEAVNMVTRRQPKFPYLSADNALLANVMGRQSMICLHHACQLGRRSAQTGAQLTTDILQAAAFGGGLAINISGTFEQNDRKALPDLKRVFNYLRDSEDAYAGLRNRGEVALVYSKKSIDYNEGREVTATSMFDIMMEGHVSDHVSEYRGIFEALTQRHILFDAVHDGFLPACDLSSYQTVILPDVTCMEDDAIGAIDKYVKNGGNLIVTGGPAAIKDGCGRLRNAIGLSSLPYRMTGSAAASGYLSIKDGSLFPALKTDLIGFMGKFYTLEPEEGSQLLLRELNRIPSPKCNKPEFAFTEETTKEYGLLVNAYGKGKVVVLPWQPGMLQQKFGIAEIGPIVEDLLTWLGWERSIKTSAPYSVQIALADCDEGELLHIINMTGLQGKPQLEVIPLHDISISVKTSCRNAQSLTQRELYTTYAENDGCLNITLPVLSDFEAVMLR